MAPRKVKGKGREIETEKKGSSNSIDSDIISNLPRNIVDNILICLPIQDAARTSVLSRQWRFKWLAIPQLVFNSDTNELFSSKISKSPNKIWSRIYQILLLHRGPLQKFYFSFDKDVEDACSFLNQIILFLTGKHLQEFTLVPPNAMSYTVPSTLFRCTHLTHLNLVYCIFRLPREFMGFSKLVSVQLYWVVITAYDLNTFLSKCLVLRRLKLVHINDMDKTIEIDAPNLKFLYFHCPEMYIVFKNVPVLSTVILNAGSLGLPFDTFTMFGNLPAIEYFSAGPSFVQGVPVDIILERLPSMLNHLRYVELSGLCFNRTEEFQFAILMLRSSPNLQKLKIQLDKYEDFDEKPIKSFCADQDSFDQLSEVVMENFSGPFRELEFIEVLLAKSFALKKIIIQPPGEFSISDKELFEIAKAVNQFQRASPRAQIIFIDGVEDMEDNSDTSSRLFQLVKNRAYKFDYC